MIKQRYFNEEVGFVENPENFIRSCIIPELEFLRLNKPNKINNFLSFLEEDIVYIKHYLNDFNIYYDKKLMKKYQKNWEKIKFDEEGVVI